jgi:hypothetical protein
MSIFSLRASLRQYASHLSKEQRRKWFAQRCRLTPKVSVSSAYIPPSIARQYQHILSIRGGA